jgi:hypothetical protein
VIRTDLRERLAAGQVPSEARRFAVDRWDQTAKGSVARWDHGT